MQVSRTSLSRAVRRRLIAMKRELPAEQVLYLSGDIEPSVWWACLLSIAGLAVLGVLVMQSADWRLHVPFVIGGVLLFGWAAVSIRRLVWQLQTRGGFALMTQRFFIVVDRAGVRSQPVWKFEQCVSKGAASGHHELLFRFGEQTLAVPYPASEKEKAETFVRWLMTYREECERKFEDWPIELRVEANNWAGWDDVDPFPGYPDEAKYGLRTDTTKPSFMRRVKLRWIEMAALILSAAALFFAVAAVIDQNAFLEADAIGTASAYRTYLRDSRNTYHRRTARYRIYALYNREIDEYNAQWGTSSGAVAFIKMLEYLRDNNLYSVPLVFEGRNEVEDVRVEGLSVVSAVESFSISKNFSRERSLSVEVSRTIGGVFPSDILQIDEGRAGYGPYIAVSYTYSNKPDSFYYPTEQGNLAEGARTWYHGVEIRWSLSLYLSSQQQPIHQFQLTSTPAPYFTAYGEGTAAVYDAMAESAFGDFEYAFYEEFLSGR
ncbi:hypothetical protein KAU37_12085 [Candidatus Bipolaricaulota bacterium]|nr:hypothetical protein [Candidatus Bipolaricaulota bacterium]